ncbi:carbohydrate ABC transporter ATP-binding protein (CUT1 family) [Aliiruegeria haliotis]|uniref:Carbohydrate ABC transporter ATP-binding protein (CUT1 family) n=1 Tax=Aliiruegeria haliotis TaxID=1280846 RepID=A0A2T0RRA1_9RHOB|nr:sn-glycerol-3-phosphate ABC transporter ATP-binding protein UgpC [Aliiruegeria haliotis]PRY23714.1 carbohydrate ABC transporter ATP-binding protein (CUT1 family) [Aliiruegeria haliotis]
MHSVSIRSLDLHFGAVKVLQNLDLDIHDGEFLVLLGSSGCGKSTLLNCIAGLLDVTDGQIFIKDRNVTWMEPSERGIGMVFQSYALYPQMTVEGNLSFGLKNARMPRAEIDERVARAARILQIEPLLKRKPGALSGGQRQRVAIGRALVRDVDVFLFDEPLSNLDAKLRADLRVEIKRLHQKLSNTMIYVTHDQVEAMTLADRIAIMKGGQIMQLATPAEIYNRPGNKYVADFIGSPSMNFLEGDLSDGHFTTGGENLDITGYPFEGPATGAATLGVRPEHVATGHDLQGLPIQAEVAVELVEPMGSDTLVWTTFAGQSFRFRMDGQAEVRERDTIRIGIDPAKASFFDKASELRL